MPHLAPPTLTAAEQKAILRLSAVNVRDHTIFSVALGTGLRLGRVGRNAFSPEAAGGRFPRWPGTSTWCAAETAACTAG